MNTAQIIKRARVLADAIRIDKSVSPLWGNEEMLDLCNEVNDKMQVKLRLAGRHFLQRRMLSTDAPQVILGRNYNPVNLRLVPNAFTLQLPPDCIEVLRLTPKVDPTNASAVNVRFWPRDITDPTFIASDLQGQMLVNQIIPFGQTVYLYDLVGPLTLRFSPMAVTTLDTELLYAARSSVLTQSSAGRITINGTSIAGVGGTDFTAINGSAELVVGAAVSGNGAVTAPNVDLNTDYPPVSSINSDTSLTMSDAFPAMPGEYSYILAGVPNVPPQHHRWFAQLVSDLMLRKVSIQLAQQRFAATLQAWAEDVQPDIARARQTQEPVYTVPYQFEDM